MSKLIEFQVAFGAVRHFGRNLYTSNPPAISELIANSWDAYATEVSIYLKEEILILADNGIGMTVEEFQERYAVSGYEKQLEVRKPKNISKRKYMGKKGIGKFASFSLGDEYIIYTKDDKSDEWLKIKLNEKDLFQEKAVVEIEYEEIKDFNHENNKDLIMFNKFSSGTIISIKKMRRKITSATINGLEKSIGRRFYLSENDVFNVKIIDEENKEIEIDFKKSFYYDNVEFLYSIGLSQAEKDKFANINEIIDIPNEDLLNLDIKGWIGTVRKPSDLKNEGETYNGISIYINGKVADENILKTKISAVSSSTYIVGEIHADYLQNLEIDPVLSSREGLNLELDNVKQLRDMIESIRNRIINEWNKKRSSIDSVEADYLSSIEKNSEYKAIYNAMNREKQSHVRELAQKLFDKPGSDKIQDTSVNNMIMSGILQIVNRDDFQKLEIKEMDTIEEAVDKMKILFDSTLVNYALRLKDNNIDRLNIIKKLQELQEEEAKEKLFEIELENAPWLINPQWDQSKVDVDKTKKMNKVFIENGEGQKTIGYIDIFIKVSESEYPIIVEIKREKKTNYSTPNVDGIIQQLKKYREAYGLMNSIPFEIAKARIKLYFICGNAAKKKLEKQGSYGIPKLKDAGIELLTYDEIIENNLNLFQNEN